MEKDTHCLVRFAKQCKFDSFMRQSGLKRSSKFRKGHFCQECSFSTLFLVFPFLCICVALGGVWSLHSLSTPAAYLIQSPLTLQYKEPLQSSTLLPDCLLFLVVRCLAIISNSEKFFATYLSMQNSVSTPASQSSGSPVHCQPVFVNNKPFL